MNKSEIKESGQVYIMNCHGYYYIGVHKGDIFKDDYYGSGIRWVNIINKYGKDKCERKVIAVYDNQRIRDDLEKYYISYYRKIYKDKVVNIADGGQGGNLGPEVNKKISQKCSGSGNGMFGKKLSEETLQKISDKLKGHPNYNRGGWHQPKTAKIQISEKNKNKHHSAKSIEKIKEARRNQTNLNLTSAKGKHWYYNPSTGEELQIFEKDKPKGFVLGRKPLDTKGKIYWNNGEIDVLLNKNELPPQGFIKGRKTKIEYTEERNQKISDKLKGRPKSEEMKKKLSEINKGKPSPMKGKHLSEEAKQKISEKAKGRTPWNKGLKLKEEK